jgi:hypothetical protein
MGIEATAETQEGPAPSKHEHLLVAKGCTLAAACVYLRDLGRTILGHSQRDDGRWVIKLMAERTS